MITTISFLLIAFLSGCQTNQQAVMQEQDNQFPVNKTENEWKQELSAEEYRVLREKGTERAFTGEFYKHNESGVYTCAACQNPLFTSDTKYESGSGWPSFYAPIEEGKIKLLLDKTHGMTRVEIVCGNCGGHLGHVFEDGPQPTGQRYCVNSLSLDFVKKDTTDSNEKP
ncbi:MAG: peptide-methionine (R)-S-oxide reductase MsrB [Bacteroidia bacterium]|nr:peptide-methionine (R)-S-oxide reductase MsrB [Bacteroidia bacterium]